MLPQISFIIPYYENHSWLPEAIASIETHCSVPYEVLIIDDCSPETPILDQLDHSQLRILRQNTNQGPGAARNRGISEARGEFIAFLDSDDFLISDPRLMLNMIEGHDMAIGKYREGATYPLLGKTFPRTVTLKDDPVLIKMMGFWSHLYRRSFLQKHDIVFPEDMKFAEDLTFYAVALAKANSAVLTGVPLLSHRAHSDSISAEGITLEHVECIFRKMPPRIMPVLQEFPEAYAIRFCMAFSSCLQHLNAIEKLHGLEEKRKAEHWLHNFASTYGHIANLKDHISRYNILWDEERDTLLKELTHKDTKAAPNFITKLWTTLFRR